MSPKKKSLKIGILSAGGDCPGINAAIRGVGKTAIVEYGMQVIGISSGFLGLINEEYEILTEEKLSGILTLGGTILGTSREKPFKKDKAGAQDQVDKPKLIKKHYKELGLDALVCIGGNGTQKTASKLVDEGLNVIGLPKTIDNDVWGTDITFGFDSALGIATDAIDRLHSTAHSHHRIIVVEIMGHNTGWLGLGAGLASGADVILIPEIPYDVRQVAEAIRRRRHRGKNFSIVAVSEGALALEDAKELARLQQKKQTAKDDKKTKKVAAELEAFRANHATNTLRLSAQLEALTGLESRVTILGHLQRGGTPTATDRILATRLGTACAAAIDAQRFGCMVAVKGESTELVDLADVVGKRKVVPLDHPWIRAALETGACLGNHIL